MLKYITVCLLAGALSVECAGQLIKAPAKKPASNKETPKARVMNSKEQFDYYGDFFFGLAQRGREGRYGFIDRYGKFIIPMIYEGAYDFIEGLALVQLHGKWGFLDPKGREVIPIQYDDATYFKDGRAVVKQNGKWGYIDKSGKVVIPLKYEDAIFYDLGYAPVMLNGKWGCIDKSGKVMIPFQYDDPDHIYEILRERRYFKGR